MHVYISLLLCASISLCVVFLLWLLSVVVCVWVLYMSLLLCVVIYVCVVYIIRVMVLWISMGRSVSRSKSLRV